MTAAAFKSEREKRGTQAQVAWMLGVHRVTIAKCETGAMLIPRMAELAILSLPKNRKRRKTSEPASSR